jgi:galactokinase/mevalonate kinase-like predicted kinase
MDSIETTLMGNPAMNWFTVRGLWEFQNVYAAKDIYFAEIFPVVSQKDLNQGFVDWLLTSNPETIHENQHFAVFYLKAKKLSGAGIIRATNLDRLFFQRSENLKHSLQALARNNQLSIFYQLDLQRLVDEFISLGLPLPAELPDDMPRMTRIHDAMLRSVYLKHQENGRKAAGFYEEKAFSLLREGIMEDLRAQKLQPEMSLMPEQILWGRSPVRLDLAGGWTDTPPYCILFGGKVVNMAVELNGQPPLQVFIRPKEKPGITIRSIDLGVSEEISNYSDLDLHTQVGSAFAIPKAALVLCGFHPDFSSIRYKSLKEQLRAFGGGFDISVMVAVPKGSGLGTSSILASTILGALSEFCRLGWDRHAIAGRTLILEQMLTTGGGWQDQFGGIFEGVKLLESTAGFQQKPSVKWAPDHLFTNPASRELILLYYTGINRVAKTILQDIVRGMFLNSAAHLPVLARMKQHAVHTYEAIQNHDWTGLTNAIGHSWQLNQQLDAGTNTPEISSILGLIEDYMLSAKLLGAGGGGYLMIFTKDAIAATRIRSILAQNPPNPRARFVDWGLSETGFRLSTS